MLKKVILLLITFTFYSNYTTFSSTETLLENKYYPLFQEIEEQAIINLNLLIDEAYVEYEMKKANNELTLPILFSYIEKGNKLEEEVDIAFQSLLEEMKIEVQQYGLSNHLISAYEKQYMKSKRKNKLKLLKNITLEGQTITFQN